MYYPFNFVFSLQFLAHFKKVFIYCTLLYTVHVHACIYKITYLTSIQINITWTLQLPGLEPVYSIPRRSSKLHEEHHVRLFILNLPLVSMTSFSKNPANSSWIPSMRWDRSSFSRLLSFYRKGDQYEYINHHNKNCEWNSIKLMVIKLWIYCLRLMSCAHWWTCEWTHKRSIHISSSPPAASRTLQEQNSIKIIIKHHNCNETSSKQMSRRSSYDLPRP
jgi:hypothetical protein